MFDINKVDEIIDKYADTILFDVDNYVSPENVKALAELLSARSKYLEDSLHIIPHTDDIIEKLLNENGSGDE